MSRRKSQQRINQSWRGVPRVAVPMIACPYCHSTRPRTERSEQGGDGSVSRRCTCRRCAERFIAILEPPNLDGSFPCRGTELLDTSYF